MKYLRLALLVGGVVSAMLALFLVSPLKSHALPPSTACSHAENAPVDDSCLVPPEIPQVPALASPSACGHQDLVGKKVSDVDLKAFTVPVRVLAPGAAATMDYNPERINLIIEEGTDFILQVTCG